MYLHLSKSGGTSICQLARLNQCTRVAATRDVFVSNCADRAKHDGAWWLPESSLERLSNEAQRYFARGGFGIPETPKANKRACHQRGRRHRQPVWGGPAGEPIFAAVEGAAPERTRCPGMLEMIVLREPIARLASFGR